MMKSMQLQYVAATQPNHQDYRGRGYYGGQNNFCGRGGRGFQRRENWRGGRGSRGSSYLTNYCWTHGICAQPGNEFRTSEEFHNKNSVWCNNISGRKRNCTCQVGSVPASNPNVAENKTSYAPKLLCSSNVDPPQHTTIIAKADIGASNNYWLTEDQLFTTDIKDTTNGPIVKLTNNTTLNTTKTRNTLLSGSLRIHAKNAQIFDGLHNDLLIYLGKLCDDD